MSHKLPILLLTSALTLSGVLVAQAQTLGEQISVTQISTTLNQIGTPNIKTPAVIPAASSASSAVPATTSAATTSAAGTSASGSVAGSLNLPISTPSAAYLAALGTAQQSLQAGNYRQAQAQYEALVAEDYQNPQAHFGLGLSLFALSDLQGARFEFGQLSTLNPTGFEGPYNLGVVANRQGQSAEALTQFSKAAELARGKVSVSVLRQVLEALAGEQARKPDYPGLVSTLSEMAKNEPTDLTLQYRQAQALALAGQGTLALPLLYAVRQQQPGNTDAALLTADIYASQNLNDRAIRELNSAVTPAPDGSARARLLLRKAELLAASGKARDAVLAAQDAVSADSRNASAQARLGELRYARNDRAAALAAWQAATRLEPRNALYLANQAVVELALGQNAQAATDARRASTLAAASDTGAAASVARAQFVLGVASYRQGNYSAARSALASSVLKVPSAEASLWLGLSSYALKDYNGAVNALQDSLKLQPSSSTQLSLGSALIAAGRYADAESVLRPLVVADARNAEAWYQLGLSRRALGREAEAQSSFRTAASLGNVRARSALK